MSETIAARVRCRGRLHTVRLTGGRLQLPDHDVGRESRLIELGGEECRCMEVLRLWRGHHCLGFPGKGPYPGVHTRIPHVLRDPYEARWAKWRVRTAAAGRYQDPMVEPVATRHTRQIYRQLRVLMLQLGYARARGADHREHVTIGPAAATGYAHATFGLVRRSHWEFRVPVTWYSRVCLRGLAVLDGQLVLQVLGETPLTVLAVRQEGPDLRLIAGRARVVGPGWGRYLEWE